MGKRQDMHNKKIAVIIPIYKALNHYESVALQQAYRVLARYDVIAIISQKLSLETKFTKIESFQDHFFNSVADYNRLMLSVEFYNRFRAYEYILIYQLDAFVFSDRLFEFCELGYDYIGAPWISGMIDWTGEKPNVLYVGNGGLSLRRVESFIEILEKEQPLNRGERRNEDIFFSSVISEKFKIAPLKVALEFAFERQVEKCYEMNDYKLPFGCHAWERYDFKFWKPHMEQFGYELKENLGAGDEDIQLLQDYKREVFLVDILEQGRNSKTAISILKCYMGDSEYVLFGAGFWGKQLGKWLISNKISIKYYCDNSKCLKGKQIEECTIVMPYEMVQDKEKIKIIVAMVNHVQEVKMQLEEMGFERYSNYILLDDVIDMTQINGEIK